MWCDRLEKLDLIHRFKYLGSDRAILQMHKDRELHNFSLCMTINS